MLLNDKFRPEIFFTKNKDGYEVYTASFIYHYVSILYKGKLSHNISVWDLDDCITDAYKTFYDIKINNNQDYFDFINSDDFLKELKEYTAFLVRRIIIDEYLETF